MRPTRSSWPFIVCGALLALGCGEENPRAPVYPVTGTVTLNGAPLEGAVVTFAPVADGKSATGITNASGQYQLTTWAANDGASAGRYRITVTKYGAAPGAAAAAEGEDAGVEPNYDAEEFDEYPDDYDEMEESEVAAATATNILPPQYADPNTSGFEVEVVAGENPPADFGLEG